MDKGGNNEKFSIKERKHNPLATFLNSVAHKSWTSNENKARRITS